MAGLMREGDWIFETFSASMRRNHFKFTHQ